MGFHPPPACHADFGPGLRGTASRQGDAAADVSADSVFAFATAALAGGGETRDIDGVLVRIFGLWRNLADSLCEFGWITPRSIARSVTRPFLAAVH